LNADLAFGTQCGLLAALDDAIAAHTIGYPDLAGQAGDFQPPAVQGQDLVFGHFDTLWPVWRGSSEHACRSLRIGFPISNGNIDQESRHRQEQPAKRRRAQLTFSANCAHSFDHQL
jgi:hypothetical protein